MASILSYRPVRAVPRTTISDLTHELTDLQATNELSEESKQLVPEITRLKYLKALLTYGTTTQPGASDEDNESR